MYGIDGYCTPYIVSYQADKHLLTQAAWKENDFLSRYAAAKGPIEDTR
jgi:hypothetical protein